MLRLNRGTKIGLAIVTLVVLAFMYVPMFVIIMNSFNSGKVPGWPIPGFSLEWWEKTIVNPAMHAALLNSVIVALVATAFALVLGTLAAFALQRFKFFGQHRRDCLKNRHQPPPL